MQNSDFFDLACAYAQGVDRKDTEQILNTFVDSAVLISPLVVLNGHDEISTIPAIQEQMFAATQHRIMNVTAIVEGDAAKGETYCTALHLKKEGDKHLVEEWAIRYQDKYSKTDSGWKFTRRELVVDWIEVRPAVLFSEQYPPQ